MSDLLIALMQPIPGKNELRDVYRAQDGDWYITYSQSLPSNLRRKYSYQEIKQEIRAGRLRPTYLGVTDSYTTGKTIDLYATQQARRKIGKHASLVYVESD